MGVWKMHSNYFRLGTLSAGVLLIAAIAFAEPYLGAVNHDVKRDRIIAIAEDYTSLYWYCGPENIDYSGYWGATCPDPTVGWKTGAKYCWGGEDTTAQYLEKIAAGWGAGNRWTWSGSSFDQFCAGDDCSGMASNCWTSPRRYTWNISDIRVNILWENLRMGDATNKSGSHIRVFDYYVSNSGQLMFYESTAGGYLQLWKAVHRALARDDTYQPIRYNNPSGYGVYDYAEPTITYIKRTGVERVEVRWDGQADNGFRLYQSTDGSSWVLIRDTTELTPSMRTCEVSGLLPDTSYFFKMTSVNSGGETIDSAVAAYRFDGYTPRVLLVDGADRYREQFSANHTFLTRVGTALGACGLGFDFCSNEGVVDEQIPLDDYDAVVWILAEESTFDETFSWPEQMHITNFLKGGGHLFISGSEIAWDLDLNGNYTGWKNGSTNDTPFYNQYLRADYSADDAETYQVAGASSSIFDGLNFSFDNGTYGTYDVEFPDVITGINGGTAGLNYQGGTGGVACVYGSSPSSGTVVNMGFGFETIYPESARNAVMKAVFGYFDIPVEPPTIKSVLQTATDAVTITWDGHASQGFRLFQKTGSGSWTQIQNEATLGPDARSTVVSSLSASTRYAFKLQAVNSVGASSDSDVLCAALGDSGNKILIVDGYDRWNAQITQSGGNNHTLIENFADALSANSARYDSCTNETVTNGDVALSTYDIVMWMCGEESTESETFSAAEQILVQDYLKDGGRLFVSGAEIGWDLVYKADGANDYSNGSSNDTPFFNNYLKAGYVQDDANMYNVTGISGSIFEGISFSFDDGTHGIYDAEYPDVLSISGGSAACLYYDSGPDIAGVSFEGMFSGGSSEGKVIMFGFPFETIYDGTARSNVMGSILNFLAEPLPTPTPTPTPTATATPTPVTPIKQYTFDTTVENWSFLGLNVPPYFSPASSSYSGGRLGISSASDSTNRVGFWNGPTEIAYVAGNVYRARFLVSSSQATASQNPQFRMRWLQQQALESASHVVNASAPQSYSLPTDPTQKEYASYFAPILAYNLGVAFDMLDFSAGQYGAHYVDQVIVERFPDPAAGTAVKTYTSSTDFTNWAFVTSVGYGPVTSGGSGTGTLSITSTTANSSNFGWWQSSGTANELTYVADKLYRATYTLRCATDAARNDMPQVRLRCQNEDGQMTATMELNSQGVGPGAMPTVGGTDYDVYFETPTLPGSPTTGQDGFFAAIDMLDFDAAKGGTIYMDSVAIDYLTIP